MESKAYLNYVRISPRKVSVVLDLIRGKDAKLAKAILEQTPKAACEPLLKLLKSAVANAENNHDMDVASLYVAECYVNQGPTLKRPRTSPWCSRKENKEVELWARKLIRTVYV